MYEPDLRCPETEAFLRHLTSPMTRHHSNYENTLDHANHQPASELLAGISYLDDALHRKFKDSSTASQKMSDVKVKLYRYVRFVRGGPFDRSLIKSL